MSATDQRNDQQRTGFAPGFEIVRNSVPRCLRREERANKRANEGQTRGNRRRIYKNIEESKEEKEEASSDEEELDEPCINYKDIKQWEADNGKQWEGWIDWSD